MIRASSVRRGRTVAAIGGGVPRPRRVHHRRGDGGAGDACLRSSRVPSGHRGPGRQGARVVADPPSGRQGRAGRPDRRRRPDDRGRKVGGDFSSRHSTWRSDQAPLAYNSRYEIAARAVDSDGVATRTTTWVRTVKPKRLAYTGLSPYGGSVVGVGMPVIMTFDQPVHAQGRRREAPVGRHQAGRGRQLVLGQRPDGALASQGVLEARYRRDRAQQARGRQPRRGVWGDDDDLARFSVGSSTISTVDIGRAHDGGRTERRSRPQRFPITTGKPGWDTRDRHQGDHLQGA